MSTAWSYSSIKTFDQCPRKYFHLKVLKDVKDYGNQATIYGQEVHKACEDYVKDDVEIPEKFAYVRGVVEAIKRMDGDKHTELKLGVKKVEGGYEPCKFLGKDVWWRGIGDVVVIRGDIGYSLDYKTSKNARYADTKQLDLVAAGLFVHFPQLKKVKSGLLFVVSNEFIHKEHFVEQRDDYFDTFKDQLDRLDSAEVSGVWNAKTGPLCKFCPVTRCEHNRKG